MDGVVSAAMALRCVAIGAKAIWTCSRIHKPCQGLRFPILAAHRPALRLLETLSPAPRRSHTPTSPCNACMHPPSSDPFSRFALRIKFKTRFPTFLWSFFFPFYFRHANGLVWALSEPPVCLLFVCIPACQLIGLGWLYVCLSVLSVLSAFPRLYRVCTLSVCGLSIYEPRTYIYDKRTNRCEKPKDTTQRGNGANPFVP